VRIPSHGLCIVMEHVNGPSLATALGDGSITSLSLKQRLVIGLGIAKGMGEIHTAGIVHRDFKPENCMLEKKSGSTEYIPKIADFGVSFLLRTASATHMKNKEGTVGYDAPEVADGNSPSVKADIYALSFTLYELLTGRRPFIGLKESQILRQYTIGGTRPKDWTLAKSNNNNNAELVPDTVIRVIQRGWSQEPNDRASIGEIISTLHSALTNSDKCAVLLQSLINEDLRVGNLIDVDEAMANFDGFQLFGIVQLLRRIIVEDIDAMNLLVKHTREMFRQ